MWVKAYAALGGLTLAALTWVYATGWEPTSVSENRDVPASVRNNPGSYRSSYGGGRIFTGGK